MAGGYDREVQGKQHIPAVIPDAEAYYEKRA